jgi:hypothetical protein
MTPNFEQMFADGQLQSPPLDVRLVALGKSRGEDAVIDIYWRDQSCRYVVELKRDAKPRTLQIAREEVKQWAQRSGQGLPMVVAPYLTSKKLDELLNQGVSAMDFCGNAAIEAPGRFLFYKTGNPNRYPDSAPIRSAYQGDGSLVARVLLLIREVQAISDIRTAIIERGGSLTLSAVSKVLQRLDADLVIERPNRSNLRVIQPERILEGLLDAYQPPRIASTWTGKVDTAIADLLARMASRFNDGGVVRTGVSSASDYAAWASEPINSFYCRQPPPALLENLKLPFKETRAFPNLRFIQTDDQRVYFDRRRNLSASPIQSWLEMASGDKRQKEVAEQIRELILKS